VLKRKSVKRTVGLRTGSIWIPRSEGPLVNRPAREGGVGSLISCRSAEGATDWCRPFGPRRSQKIASPALTDGANNSRSFGPGASAVLKQNQYLSLRTQLLLLATLCILLSSVSVFAQRRKGQTTKPLPPVVAVDAAGLQALLKRGDAELAKPLLVNYWATWCDPCREEFPDLVKLDAHYRPKGLDFIAITLDDLADIKTGVPGFLREMHAQMPVYLLNLSDPEPAINMVDPKWGGALPATFLYNAKGEVVYKSLGRINVNELRAAIDKVMSHLD
jgi:thiol-disulfide isomerase/thioredoxin